MSGKVKTFLLQSQLTSLLLQGIHDSVCLCTMPMWIFTLCIDHSLNPKAREWDSIQPSESHTPRWGTRAQRRQQNNCKHMSSLFLGLSFHSCETITESGLLGSGAVQGCRFPISTLNTDLTRKTTIVNRVGHSLLIWVERK